MHLHNFSMIKSLKEVIKHSKLRFFLLDLLHDGRIRIRNRTNNDGSILIMTGPDPGGQKTYGSSESRSTTLLTRQSLHTPMKGNRFFLKTFQRCMIRGGYNKRTVKRCTLKRRWAMSNTAPFSAPKWTERNKKTQRAPTRWRCNSRQFCL